MSPTQSPSDSGIQFEPIASQEAQDILQHAPIGVFRSTPEGRFISINPAMARMFGYDSPQEMIESISDIAEEYYVDPSDREEFVSQMHEQGQVVNHECRVHCRDGSIIWVSRNAREVRDKNGKITHYQGFVTDITERKLAEETLRESQEQYQLLIDNLNEGIWQIDQDGYTVFVNERMAEMLGYTVQEMQGKHLFDFMDEQEAQLTKNYMQRREKGIKEQHEHVLICKDGSYIFTSLETSPVYDKDGKYVGALAGVQDVTARKTAQEALRRERDLTQRYLDTSQAIMMALDPEGRITMINRSGYELLGYTKDEIIGSNWFETFLPQPEGMDSVYPVFRRIMAGDLSSTDYFENSVVCRDGTQRLIGWHNAFLENDEGRVIGTLSSGEDITERKQAEEALRESEQRFREWFESSPISLWEQDFSSIKKRIDEIKAQNVGDLDSYFRQQPELVWELAGMVRVLDVNQAALKLYRAKSKEDFWGGITKVFSRESLEGFLLVLEVIAAGERTFVTEKEHLTLDGEPLKVQLYWKVAKGHEDTYSRILVSIIDVTDQKRAEERMRQSENYYRAIFETSGSAMFINEEDTTISHVNSNFEELLGYSKQEVEGKKSWTEFVHADDVSWMKENHYLLRRDPWVASRSYEFRFFVRNGELRQGLLTVDIIHDTSQSVVSLIDITERKLAEDALKESEEKYRDLFQSSIDGIAKSDLEGKIVDCNKAYLEMTGHSEEEIKSLTYRDLTPERWANVDREHLDQCLNRGYSDPYEKERIRKDGTVFPISIMIWLRRDSEGNLLGFWGIVRDITERKQAEEERDKLQAQLTQAQKLESVGRLAGGVAHDINNMLSVILGNTELGLQEVDSTQSLHDHLQEIQKAAQRSNDVVRQMLAFARKQTIAPEVLDLNETVEEMLKMLRRLIGEDIDLSWQPGHDIWPVKMDPAQIDQILANLSVNTRDAINGVGKLTIETGKVRFDETHCARHPYLVPGDFVLLAISDDGCGMDKETLDNIFEPFFTTKEVGQGTGLGLATVYGIVKQNNGFINVYSEPNQGTTFRIYLPRHRTDDDPVRAETSHDREVYGDETILLVEDEATILKTARMMLERLGYTVLIAATPGEAMDVARMHSEEIDLLMTDVVMPEMNGRDLAGKLLSLYPNLKWLFMSGYTENSIAHHGVLDEGVHFIQKPFSKQDLSVQVRKVLDEKD